MDDSFGYWVKRRRKALDLTQQDLARRVGCSASAIFKIENDDRRPSRQIAELLAKHLEIPAEQRSLFIKVARREKTVDRLAPIPAATEPHSQPEDAQSNLAHPKPSLPMSPNPLIGREFELAEIVHLLKEANCRLLTLTGPGGIGKTRLALEAARQLQDDCVDGACFVSLVGVIAPEFIVPAIAGALGFLFSGQADPRVQLINYLREKRLLLIVDNCEHLLEGAGWLSEMLQHAPGVRVLATSREPLHLQAEWTFEVQSLPVPNSARAEALEGSSAAQLFLQRARQARVGFALTDADRQAVLRICQSVGGLPLGIELAAAWVRTLSYPEIAEEIGRDLQFLAVSARDAPERHRSITAVFEHSWKLLSTDEQQVLRQLSVFRGGFTRQAAERVAGATLPLLSALVDKSLVRYTDAQAGRYNLHEVVQQYAAAKLQADWQEYLATLERHACTFAELLEQWQAGLRSPKQSEIVAQMEVEIDNLRQAWEWMLTHGQTAPLQQSMPAFASFLDIRSLFQEGVTLFGGAVGTFRAGPEADLKRTISLGRALAWQAYFQLRLGQHVQAEALLHESLALLRSCGDQAALADTYLYLGNTDTLLGRYREARQFTLDSIELNRALGRDWEQAYGLTLLGYIAWWQGQLPEARSLLREGVSLSRSVGDPRRTAYAILPYVAVVNTLGEQEQARQLLAESLRLSRSLNDTWGIGSTLRNLGLMALANGEARRAEALFRESVTLFKDMGDRWAMSQALLSLGEATFALGETMEAKRAYSMALQTAMEIQGLPFALAALTGIVRLLPSRNGASEHAWELLTYVLHHPAASRETKDRAEKLRAELAAQLTPQQVDASQKRAQAKTLEGIVAEIG